MQASITHLAGGKTQICPLHDQKAVPVVGADGLVANHGGTGHRAEGGEQTAAVEAALERVLEQGDINGREDGEQQYLGHGEPEERLVEKEIHQTQFDRAYGHQSRGQSPAQPAQAHHGREHQQRERDAREHGKGGIDLAGQIDTDQTERKRPKPGYANQYPHASICSVQRRKNRDYRTAFAPGGYSSAAL